MTWVRQLSPICILLDILYQVACVIAWIARFIFTIFALFLATFVVYYFVLFVGVCYIYVVLLWNFITSVDPLVLCQSVLHNLYVNLPIFYKYVTDHNLVAGIFSCALFCTAAAPVGKTVTSNDKFLPGEEGVDIDSNVRSPLYFDVTVRNVAMLAKFINQYIMLRSIKINDDDLETVVKGWVYGSVSITSRAQSLRTLLDGKLFPVFLVRFLELVPYGTNHKFMGVNVQFKIHPSFLPPELSEVSESLGRINSAFNHAGLYKELIPVRFKENIKLLEVPVFSRTEHGITEYKFLMSSYDGLPYVVFAGFYIFGVACDSVFLEGLYPTRIVVDPWYWDVYFQRSCRYILEHLCKGEAQASPGKSSGSKSSRRDKSRRADTGRANRTGRPSNRSERGQAQPVNTAAPETAVETRSGKNTTGQRSSQR
jgi:hypothetical protein